MYVGGAWEEVREGLCPSFVIKNPKLIVFDYVMLADGHCRGKGSEKSSTSGNFKSWKRHTSLLLIFYWPKQVVWPQIMTRGWERCSFAMRLERQLEIFDGEQ